MAARVPIEVLGLSLMSKRVLGLENVTVRLSTPKECARWDVASEEDFPPATRSMEEIKTQNDAVRKVMKRSTRKARAAKTRAFNNHLRYRGIDPDKFRALVKRAYGVSPEEFEKLMWQECRLEQRCLDTESR